VFVDIDSGALNIDPDAIKDAITERTKAVRALIFSRTWAVADVQT
jgi:dTDP-4-amino-4,6-dideoxygalactose transaminase